MFGRKYRRFLVGLAVVAMFAATTLSASAFGGMGCSCVWSPPSGFLGLGCLFGGPSYVVYPAYGATCCDPCYCASTYCDICCNTPCVCDLGCGCTTSLGCGWNYRYGCGWGCGHGCGCGYGYAVVAEPCCERDASTDAAIRTLEDEGLIESDQIESQPRTFDGAPTDTDAIPLSRETTGSVILTVMVPEDARVYVNGAATTTPGTVRQFATHGLKSGYTYDYEVVVEVVRDGEQVRRTRRVPLSVGRNQEIAFTELFPADTHIAAR